MSRRHGKSRSGPPFGNKSSGRAPRPPVIVDARSAPFGDLDSMIATLGRIEALAVGLKDSGQDLYDLFKSFDPSGAMLKKLDRAEVEAIPAVLKGHALRAFCAAQATAKAREHGLLEMLTRHGVVAFVENDYIRKIPQIAAVARDVPQYPVPVMGVLQDEIKDHAVALGAIVPRYMDADTAPPGTKVDDGGLTREEIEYLSRNKIDPGCYYHMLQDTLELTFGVMEYKPGDATKLAEVYAPLFFTWLGATGMLGILADGLVTGNPYIRKKVASDGTFSYLDR